MDFGTKIQKLRKEQGWTQEQLAEKLFISRTAVSKWESSKGYPNIESLKNIAKLFSVSIDDLLSGEELVSLATVENRRNLDQVFVWFFGMIDLMMLSILFLPLFGQADGKMIRMVNLFVFADASTITRALYFIFPILMGLLGLSELLFCWLNFKKLLVLSKKGSFALHVAIIFLFINTRQPYAASLVFMFFMLKLVLLLKRDKTK